MESRIHGDMYVRFGGRLAETYHRKVAKRCGPSLLKILGAFCEIKKKLTSHVARHTFATTIALANGVRIEVISKMLGHTNIQTTQLYAHIYQAEVDKEFERLNNIV